MSKNFPEELRGELVSGLQEVQQRLAEKREAEKQDDPGQSTEQGGSVEPQQAEREGQRSQSAGIRIGGSIQYNLPTILNATEDEDLQERESALRAPDPAKPRTGPGGLRRARRIDDTVDDIAQRQQRALKAAIELAEEQGHFEEAERMREQITETPSVFSDVMAANVEQENREQEEREREATLVAMETEEETAERHRQETAMIEQQEKERQAAEEERQDDDDDYGDDNEDEYYDDNDDDNGGQLGQSFVQEKRREWDDQQKVKMELTEPGEEPIEEPIDEPAEEPGNQGEDEDTVQRDAGNPEPEPQPGTSGIENPDEEEDDPNVRGVRLLRGRRLDDDERTELEEDYKVPTRIDTEWEVQEEDPGEVEEDDEFVPECFHSLNERQSEKFIQYATEQTERFVNLILEERDRIVRTQYYYKLVRTMRRAMEITGAYGTGMLNAKIYKVLKHVTDPTCLAIRKMEAGVLTTQEEGMRETRKILDRKLEAIEGKTEEQLIESVKCKTPAQQKLVKAKFGKLFKHMERSHTEAAAACRILSELSEDLDEKTIVQLVTAVTQPLIYAHAPVMEIARKEAEMQTAKKKEEEDEAIGEVVIRHNLPRAPHADKREAQGDRATALLAATVWHYLHQVLFTKLPQPSVEKIAQKFYVSRSTLQKCITGKRYAGGGQDKSKLVQDTLERLAREEGVDADVVAEAETRTVEAPVRRQDIKAAAGMKRKGAPGAAKSSKKKKTDATVVTVRDASEIVDTGEEQSTEVTPTPVVE